MCPQGRCIAALFSGVLILLSALTTLPVAAAQNALRDASSAAAVSVAADDAVTMGRLHNGEVVVDLLENEKTKFVVGKILINQPPEVVWPILVNPFEFQGKISSRMKQVDVLVDEPNVSVLRCSISVCFPFPMISYTVESKYDGAKTIEFRRLDGFFRDFRGCWYLRPCDHGTATEVLYSMYVDPGIPVPRWLVREGVKCELPKTLLLFRDRVNAIATAKAVPESRNIAAGFAARSKLLQPIAGKPPPI